MEKNNYNNTTTRGVAKSLAKEEMKSLSESKIKEIEKEEKRSFFIATIFVSISTIIMLFCCVISFLDEINDMGFFGLILFVPSLIATIWFICTYFNRDRAEWVISNLAKKYIRNPHLIYSMTNESNANDLVSDSENPNEINAKREQLQTLKEMLDRGLITQEDYEQKKKQILGL